MSAFFENIIQSIDFAKYLENIDKRKIVLWGTSENNKFLLDMLNNNGYEVSLILDSKLDISKEENAVTDKEILGAEILKNNSKDFYVFVTHDYDEKIENYLNENNYLEEKDYLYIIHKPVVVLKDEEYTDIYGNKIKAPKGTKFKVLGYNNIININTEINDKIQISAIGGNSIYIGSNCNIGENITIECNGESSVRIGDSCLIGDNVSIVCVDNSSINLSSPCKIRKESLIGAFEKSSINLQEKTSFQNKTIFFAKKGSSITVGKKSHSGENLRCIAYFGGKIDVGADCMFSEYVSFVNNDGHPIFDVKSGKQINGQKNIILGEHVWVGIKCTLISGTHIGEASIVGANSLVNKTFPNNCIIAGNPAKIVREDIAWDREIINSDEIDKSIYWNLTSYIYD
ncbi:MULTISPECIES: hypothetical protein [Clostridium]|uniref:acyltransferase n=1 Tax=Clostridium TaxID=1485 RepID=UPI0025904EE1|nr:MULTISPECIES: hypothetical protein [Clostridium]MDU4848024.1 hypothetical protein [Clostridium sp.]CAI3199458.1 Conserved hypothetical protein [Clostridium neonatale]CAI3210516.1 Conserved hypothetical protein [Clostridium neonatale]CAI3621930.1 Conserved hypothetical protein [Clostridium neonatale]